MTFAARTLGFSRNLITYTFAANTADATLNVTSGTAPAGGTVVGTYSAGNTDVSIIIGNGVYIYSTAVTTPALTLTGGSGTDKITLTNNGFIIGEGGKGGGSSGSTTTYLAPTVGGTALKAGFNLSVIKGASTCIAGGGGGGGGLILVGGGGGAGGGNGGDTYLSGGSTQFVAGGAGATTPGNSGVSGTTFNTSLGSPSSGGGGGRINPLTGTGATSVIIASESVIGIGGNGSQAGAGGAVTNASSYVKAAAGGGGGWGATGGSSNNYNTTGVTFPITGGAGGANNSGGGNGVAAGGTITTTNIGASGGKAIDFNGFSVTISGSGTTYGATS